MIKFPSIKQMASPATNLTKIKSRSQNRYIFNDKIVNRKTEPTLFNVQSAATTMLAVQGNLGLRNARRMRNTETDMARLSRQTMLQMNVVVDSAPQNFSLLECNSVSDLGANPNIADNQQIDTLQPLEVQIDQFFPSEDDPILQLDDGDQSAQQYGQPSIQGKEYLANIDRIMFITFPHVGSNYK